MQRPWGMGLLPYCAIARQAAKLTNNPIAHRSLLIVSPMQPHSNKKGAAFAAPCA